MLSGAICTSSMCSVLEQMYVRFSSGHDICERERWLIRNMLSVNGVAVDQLSEMIFGVPPPTEDPDDWAKEATLMAELQHSALSICLSHVRGVHGQCEGEYGGGEDDAEKQQEPWKAAVAHALVSWEGVGGEGPDGHPT